MSVVAPNSTIRLLKDVPIDESYENTLYFASESAQRTYFLSLTPKHIMTQCTRVRDGVIRVDKLSDEILDCNYMMFQNTNFSNKWFYAFIDDVRYVNNGTSLIVYRIDEIQTWLFADNGVSLAQSFVEREHVRNDGLFKNLIPEDFTVSEYVNSDLITQEKDMSVLSAIVFTNADSGDTYDDEPVIPNITPYNGMLNGSCAKIFFVQDNNGDWYPMDKQNENDLVQLNKFIQYLLSKNKQDAIVNIILYPKDLINYSQNNEYAKEVNLEFVNYNTASEIDGYEPKNNKLYNSPYCVIEYGTSDGQKDVMRPEYLPDNCELDILTNVSPEPSFLVVPRQYAGDNYAWDMAISFNSFPQVSCAIDGYKAWVASGGESTLFLQSLQNVTNDFIKIGEGAVNIAEGQSLYKANTQFGTESGRYKGIEQSTEGIFQTAQGVADLSFDVAKTVNASAIAKRLPPSQKGVVKGTPLTTNQKISVYVRWKTINKDVAKSIDDYFTMFGYKVNTLKVPRLNNRTNFTYIKTKGCKCIGGAPSTSIVAIQNIFNRGIRFWTDPTKVGDYTVTNTPI